MPKHIVCYGLIHTLRKFQNSFTQKVIHRMIKKYVVLSDDLLAKVKPVPGIEISSFYPIDFPHYEQDYPKKDILVTLTGGVENRRKDLKSFIGMCSNSPAEVHFVFLGKSDMSREDVQVFVDELESWGIRNRVTLFPEFVDQATFDAVLKQTDFYSRSFIRIRPVRRNTFTTRSQALFRWRMHIAFRYLSTKRIALSKI